MKKYLILSSDRENFKRTMKIQKDVHLTIHQTPCSPIFCSAKKTAIEKCREWNKRKECLMYFFIEISIY